MKRLLLTIALGAMMAAPACAQWVEDTDSALVASGSNTSTYSYYSAINPNGYTFLLQWVPKGNAVPAPYLQIIDPDGKLTQGDEGLLLCANPNLTYLMVNDCLMIDSDGDAIIGIYDYRLGTSTPSYTIYKVTQTGDIKWSHTLNEAGDFEGGAKLSMAQLSDGSYVFAFEGWSYTEEVSNKVMIYHLNADGTDAWGGVKELKDAENEEDYSNPAVVNAGDGKVMVIVAQGSNQDIVARCYNADGTEAWDEEVYIYSGGFIDGMPLHTMLDIIPGPKNGAVVTWINPDYTNGTYENRINYILPDGTITTGGENGVCISKDTSWSRMLPSVVYDANEESFYCVYRQFSQTVQSYHGINAQKVSTDGELLWGDKGEPIIEMQDTATYNYATIQLATEGRVAIFYLWQNNENGSYLTPVHGVMELRDDEGDLAQEPVEFATSDALKYSLEATELIDGKYYIVAWEEQPDMNSNTYHMQRVFLDGSVSAVETISKNEMRKLLRQEIYTADGKQTNALGKGLNIVRKIYDDNTVKSSKVVR